MVWINLFLARLALWIQDSDSGRQDFWLCHCPAGQPLHGHFFSLLCTLNKQRTDLLLLWGKVSLLLTCCTMSSASLSLWGWITAAQIITVDELRQCQLG